VRDGYSMGTSG
nr:immunoglobulin heavy chain junction region [Mus musculus]